MHLRSIEARAMQRLAMEEALIRDVNCMQEERHTVD